MGERDDDVEAQLPVRRHRDQHTLDHVDDESEALELWAAAQPEETDLERWDRAEQSNRGLRRWTPWRWASTETIGREGRSDHADRSESDGTAGSATTRRRRDGPPELEGRCGPVGREPPDAAITWTVDPWSSRTLRRLLLVQVALVDAGLILVGLAAVVAFVVSVDSLALALFALGGLAILTWRRFAAPIERWRQDGATSYLTNSELLVAIAVGWTLYLGLYSQLGLGSLVVLVVAFLLAGVVEHVVGDGLAEGSLDPVAGTVTFDGRSRSLETVSYGRLVWVGDLVVVRLAGPTGLDDRTWLAVTTADVDRVCGPLDAVLRARRVDDETTVGTTGLDWRRLQAPRVLGLATWIGVISVAAVGSVVLEGQYAEAAVAVLAVSGGGLLVSGFGLSIRRRLWRS